MNLIDTQTTQIPNRTPRALSGSNGLSSKTVKPSKDTREVERYEHDALINKLRFFTIKDKYTKGGTWEGAEINISAVGIQEVLLYLGFQRYDFNSEKRVMVKVVDNIVEEVSQTRIIDEFMRHVKDNYDTMIETPDGEEINRNLLIERIYRTMTIHFSEMMLHRLKVDNESFEFNKDTKDESFFYYTNGYVRVSKEKLELMEYKTLTKKVWRSQILNREFKYIKKEVADASIPGLFYNYIAGNYIENSKEKNPQRAEDLRRIVGYLLHRYYEGKLKAIVLTDSTISDDDSGRSGKTLMVEMIGWMLSDNKNENFVELDGKEFDITATFKWQLLGINTELVHLNDIKKGFSVETLFNSILSGITVQQKNQIPFIRLVKMVLSTNKTIRINGPSAMDRFVEFQLSNYFSEKRSPQDEFKVWFGKGWSVEIWQQFDNFMLQSISMYLQKGLPKVQNFNIEQRKFKDETNAEFVEFFSDNIEDWVKNKTALWKKELLATFKTNNSDMDKISQQRFTLWLKAAKTHTQFDFEETRDKGKGDFQIVFKMKEYEFAVTYTRGKDVRVEKIFCTDMEQALLKAKNASHEGETWAVIRK